ncbi:MAG: Cro/Cl family transcriptional regulator [Desulfuromonas sp.]|nr:MAG: Cro/Cl family transcriptional regulator [Desulfuromonas sp.]
MEFQIGAKIKKLRKARKLTLQDVARETGFSPALISQIENNNVSPPIATLSKLAKFFDVKMGHFFEDDVEDPRYEVVRALDRRVVSRVISQSGVGHGYTYEALSYRKRNKKMEPFVLTISERAAEETLYSHEGEEFLLILEGEAEVILEERRIELTAGDAVYFDSSLRHRLLSKGEVVLRVLAVVTR